jgi:hypothetical protein
MGWGDFQGHMEVTQHPVTPTVHPLVGTRASAASILHSHSTDSPEEGNAAQASTSTQSRAAPSCFTLPALPLSSVLPKCKSLKGHFRQGRLLGVAVLREEGQLMPMTAPAAHSQGAGLSPLPCQSCTQRPGSQ